MGSKFNLNALLSSSSINATDNGDKKLNKIKIIPISVHDLIPSKSNFYSVEEIAALKDSIEMFGLKQNLTVKALDNGKYRVIAGHRRCLASLVLIEEGKAEYEMIPCAIETDINDIKEELLLITTNATTRQLSDWEKTQQAHRMRELLEQYKKQEKIPGRIRDLIAKALETSPSQIGRMNSIARHLTEELKEEFKQDHINISTAYELSTLPIEAQQEVLEEYKDTGSLSIQDVKNKKTELREQEIEEDNRRKEQEEQPIYESDYKQEQEQEQEQSSIEDEVLKCEEVKIEEYKQPIQPIETQQYSIPTQVFSTVFEIIRSMSKHELAKFICHRCDGSGFCDYITECNYISIDQRPKVCEKWLDMQGQKG